MFIQTSGSASEPFTMSFMTVYCKFSASALFVFLLITFSAMANFAQAENNQPDPVKLFNQGQDAHEKGDLQTALKFYDEAVKISPDFPEAEYQRGAALLSLGKTSEAEKAFRRAVEIKAGWSLPLTSLGSILVSTNRFEEAEKVLSKAIELDEKNFEALSVLTELRLRSHATPEILKNLLAKIQILNARNKSSALLAAQGAIQRALGDMNSAKISLNGALSIEPSNSFALSESAEIYISERNFQNAVDAAKTLLVISLNSNAAKFRLARVFALSGNSAEALKILDGLDSADAEVSSLKNSIIANDSEDVSALEKQLEKDSKNAVVLGRLCTLFRTSDPQKALDYCSRASESEPANVNYAVGYGAALVQARQFENAIALLNRLLQIAPENYAAHANLATALFETKRFAAAKTEYIWLKDKKPELAIAYYFLAISQDRMAEYPEALANYQEFLRRADPKQNKLEIDKVNLRLPAVQKLVKQKKGK